MSDNTILTKLKATADIIGGTVFFATQEGTDPEYPASGDLLPDGMYIRLEGSDGSVAYISAFEIDRAIGIVDDMSKNHANKADVDAIISVLNDKASKTDFELLQSEVNTKASKVDVDDLVELFDTKADKTTVDTLIETVATKADQFDIDNFTQSIDSKADISEVESIKRDIEALQTAMESMTETSSIEVIKRQISYLNSELNKKLTIDDLTPIKNNVNSVVNAVEEFSGRFENIDTAISKKASTVYVQGQINSVTETINNVISKVDTKAEKNEVATKANKSDLESLTKKVTALNTTVSDTLTDINATTKEIYGAIATKADKVALDTLESELRTSISNKAEKSEVNSEINSLNTRVSSVETSQTNIYNDLSGSIENLDCEVSNTIAEMQSKLNIQSRQIDTQASQISKLQEQDHAFTEKLRNDWVRVMTPEEYKRLAPVGDKYSDGTPNPYAKQPNVIYMLVRYNRPIAVYIGEILIAQAEQKGSVGFAYTFPISF